MLSFLFSLFKINQFSIAEIEALSFPRSSKWKNLRLQHLKKNPTCAVCGSSFNVVPHHITPVHLDPSKELDASNLISLCESKTFNCHLFFGHFKNWSKHNPDVVKDAMIWSEKIKTWQNQNNSDLVLPS